MTHSSITIDSDLINIKIVMRSSINGDFTQYNFEDKRTNHFAWAIACNIIDALLPLSQNVFIRNDEGNITFIVYSERDIEWQITQSIISIFKKDMEVQMGKLHSNEVITADIRDPNMISKIVNWAVPKVAE